MREDEQILLHLQSQGMDAIAADVVYHHSCYQEFINPAALRKYKDVLEELTTGYSRAYSVLVEELEASKLK